MKRDLEEILESVMNILHGEEIYKTEVKNVKTEDKDIIYHNLEDMPNMIIFNGDYTILKWDDGEVKLKKSKEDENNPIYAFLYGYFVYHSGLRKERAKDLLESIEELGKDEKEIKLDEIEKLLDENLDLDSYFKKFKEIMNKD